MREPTEQERHEAALTLMKLTMDKKLKEKALDKILEILRSQPTLTDVYYKGAELTELLKSSKTQAEFLRKLKKSKTQTQK